MHYEVLSYNTSHILKQCEQYSQSTSSVDSSQTKQLFISLSFKAMDRYLSYYMHAFNSSSSSIALLLII